MVLREALLLGGRYCPRSEVHLAWGCGNYAVLQDFKAVAFE